MQYLLRFRLVRHAYVMKRRPHFQLIRPVLSDALTQILSLAHVPSSFKCKTHHFKRTIHHFKCKILSLAHIPSAIRGRNCRILNAKILVFNRQFLVFNTQFLVFDTKFLVLNTKFIILTHYAARTQQNACDPSA